MRREDSDVSPRDWRRESSTTRTRRISRWPVWLGALCLLVACGGRPSDPPNLVLLIGDDHGYPDFGLMGSETVRTPRLDQLARESVVFPLGYSTASLCRPALRTLLTGLEPLQYERAELALRERSGTPLHPETVVRALDTLPRLLAERGYATFQAGKYMEGHFAAAGFEDGMVEALGEPGLRAAEPLLRETLDPVLDFVDAHRDGPFFVWFAPKLPHVPHDPPARFLDLYADTDLPSGVRAYYASISWFDDGVGRLLDHLEATGLRERTLVVYLADNGWDATPPETPEHVLLGGPHGKKSLYELGFRTPILLHRPGGLEPARFEQALVSITDLFPTLLEAAGAPVPPGRVGHSLWPLVEGRGEPPRSELVGWTHVVRNAPGPRITGGYFWRDARWRYLEPDLRPAELYDLAHDPQEMRNVAAEHPDVVARGVRAIRSWRGELPEAGLREP